MVCASVAFDLSSRSFVSRSVPSRTVRRSLHFGRGS